jgi:hypothetical protein
MQKSISCYFSSGMNKSGGCLVEIGAKKYAFIVDVEEGE